MHINSIKYIPFLELPANITEEYNVVDLRTANYGSDAFPKPAEATAPSSNPAPSPPMSMSAPTSSIDMSASASSALSGSTPSDSSDPSPTPRTPKPKPAIDVEKIDLRKEGAFLAAKRKAVLLNILADTKEKEARAAFFEESKAAQVVFKENQLLQRQILEAKLMKMGRAVPPPSENLPPPPKNLPSDDNVFQMSSPIHPSQRSPSPPHLPSPTHTVSLPGSPLPPGSSHDHGELPQQVSDAGVRGQFSSSVLSSALDHSVCKFGFF